MNRLFILFLLSWIAFSSFAQEKRNLLVNEAKEIGIESVLVKNFSEIDFPTYKSRDFWDGLPTDLKKQYVQEAEAAVKKWVRGYRLDRGNKFTISDAWELAEIKDQPTSLNLITYCKVTESGPGVLNLQGDGFELKMKYNAKVVSPKIEGKKFNNNFQIKQA